jgi:hypothetical protein
MNSKLPPEDEQLFYSKQVYDIYWDKTKKEITSLWFLLCRFITMHGPYNVRCEECVLAHFYISTCYGNVTQIFLCYFLL